MLRRLNEIPMVARLMVLTGVLGPAAASLLERVGESLRLDRDLVLIANVHRDAEADD
jgi:hypothetical protein